MEHIFINIEMAEVVPEPLSFKEAIAFLKHRIPLTKKEFYELEKKLRFRAFTVARLTQFDAIERVRQRLIEVLEEGKTLRQFWIEGGHDELLMRAGFHQSNPWYWETVFRTNIQTAYNAGRAIQIRKMPVEYLEFVGIIDARQTPICQARSGVIRPANDPWWSSNWPPLHFNCRSTVRVVDRDEFEAFGLKITQPFKLKNIASPQKGFGANPIDSGSFYKLTPEMIERAKKYDIWLEIKKIAQELGIEI